MYTDDKEWKAFIKNRKEERAKFRETIPKDLPFKKFAYTALWTKIAHIPAGQTEHGYTNNTDICQTVIFELPCGGVQEARTLEEVKSIIDDIYDDTADEFKFHSVRINEY